MTLGDAVDRRELALRSRRDEARTPHGAREPEEAGVSGVLVRRAGESAVTDPEGRFRFFVRSDAPPHLDETSLPFGVVASPGAAGRPTAAGQFEIGVIPTAAVEVQLVPTAGEDGRLPRVDLATVVVRARDERGSAWTAGWRSAKG